MRSHSTILLLSIRKDDRDPLQDYTESVLQFVALLDVSPYKPQHPSTEPHPISLPSHTLLRIQSKRSSSPPNLIASKYGVRLLPLVLGPLSMPMQIRRHFNFRNNLKTRESTFSVPRRDRTHDTLFSMVRSVASGWVGRMKVATR
ncbi:hypothetical protein JAAARDRAFT_198540 [Jaapia argillacea MUCL 33604]|uniref:Uncharacterized protein n=1 Tax=Jaapia argillacea MUCL 33604 TaxID=933084 RepID=A0A067PM19_9AGAM|nr:hypothetical protein JAAARDRAFT_198540 [Jaapia argillacea MUCL 33604]